MSERHQPTGQTVIVVVPPLDICGYADHYRNLYMPTRMHTIEPHITVLYPFVHYGQLEEAMPRLRDVLAKCPPRRVSLRGFEVFREEMVLYLRLADDERIYSLYRAIYAEFPDYPAYDGRFGESFTPHMTVGRFDDPEELEKAYNELSIQRLYIGFDVEQVVVKYEVEDGVWHTWAELPLGG